MGLVKSFFEEFASTNQTFWNLSNTFENLRGRGAILILPEFLGLQNKKWRNEFLVTWIGLKIWRVYITRSCAEDGRGPGILFAYGWGDRVPKKEIRIFCKIQEKKCSGHRFGDLLVQSWCQGVQEGHGTTEDPWKPQEKIKIWLHGPPGAQVIQKLPIYRP